MQQRGRRNESERARYEHAERLERGVAPAVEDEIRRQRGEPDQNAAVQVRPESQERHHEPDALRPPAGLPTQEEQKQWEEREREELRTDDEDRGRHADENADDRNGA